MKLALNLKSIIKSEETRKQYLSGKQLRVRHLHQRNQQIFTKFREIFTIVKMIIMQKIDYLIKVAKLKITSMKIRINGSNTENRNHESTVQSNQGKLAFI